MEITTFAPVLIPTLNRYEHFRRCVESLAKCTHADKTELVIGLDYPPSEKYVDGWKKICDYVPTINGFKKVTIFKRDTNFGVGPNNIDMRNYARKHYDRYISVEDDCELSPCFLDYINKGLEKYKDDPRVFGICGYNYSVIDMAGYKKEYYFSHEMNAWGWGRWFNEKCETVIREVRKPGYLTNLVKEIPFRTFLRDGTKRCNMLMEIGLEFRGDGYYTYYQWKNNMYCMFPTISLVRNYGFDGSGLHCGVDDGNDTYSNQLIDRRKIFESDYSIPVEYNDIIRKKFKDFQTGSKRSKLKKVILLILMKLFVNIRRY